MKKVLLTTCLLAICIVGYAQNRGKTYLNLNYSSAKLSQPATEKLSNDFGVGFTIGHTYYLHKEPVADVFWFGLDATWFDINYNKFSYDRYRLTGEKRNGQGNIHEGEVGLHIGPSVTITPVKRLNIKAYFRYAPSCAFIYDTKADDEKPSFSYASMFVGGLSVNYGIIGAGFEARFGSAKLKEYQFVSGGYSSDEKEAEKVSTDISGCRVYLSFNF